MQYAYRLLKLFDAYKYLSNHLSSATILHVTCSTPYDTLCVNHLFELFSSIKDEPMESIQQWQRKCEDALYSLLILGARLPVRRLASLAMGRVISKGDGISIYSRVSSLQGWLADGKRSEPLSCAVDQHADPGKIVKLGDFAGSDSIPGLLPGCTYQVLTVMGGKILPVIGVYHPCPFLILIPELPRVWLYRLCLLPLTSLPSPYLCHCLLRVVVSVIASSPPSLHVGKAKVYSFE
ncbi:hypothetical protein C4D60_Mb06t04040 [Musa balbisiana]|uniref:Uncharacterized protein n=1 Tax=Musa balbisiana TaxID=52838 RepID=A0A4S8IKE3_MUSBA|nr:hypothetical protein C4D60_Mb06t04040 [Musa balbisiana]